MTVNAGNLNMKTMMSAMCVLILVLALPFALVAQQVDWKTFDPKKATPEEMERINKMLEENLNQQLAKGTGLPSEIRSLIMQGNKITTVVYNYGNITRPNTLSNVADLVWNNLGYGFEFTPLVAGRVIQGVDTFQILDDGMWLPNQGSYARDGSIKYGWLPKAGYAAPGQPDIAAWSHRSDVQGDLTRKPHSWPESWYNPAVGRYVWPAYLGNDATAPDEEVYFVVDDYTNALYPYYPFPSDTTKRGLGLDLEVRFFQFNNPLAEDIIFLVYRVTNRSPNTIDKVWFGMYGDPHVGGASNYADDRAYFIPPSGPLADPYPQRARSMVYAWDDDGRGDGGLPDGYFGFKFLESPTNSTDGLDNDDDGIIDESPFNAAGVYIDGITYPLSRGIADTVKYKAIYGELKPRWEGDENGNWDPTKNDVGLDGLPGTGDFGEGNGMPDIGLDNQGNITAEPNFGIRDVAESDQIGLTSFWALPYTNGVPNVPKNDQYFIQLLSSDSIDINQDLLNTAGDNIFLYGSGPFTLGPGETQRFSIALLMGNDRNDLVLNSETAQRVLEANYQFAQPPPKPKLTVVPGNGKVTLYWDTRSEQTTDPLTGVNDFEGYKIYRSQDYTFSDVFTITDANGTPFLGKPFQQEGQSAQFDLVNEWSGLHPVEYVGRGVKYNLGNNTGLVHEYVDSSVTNGVTYYYAVASYDHGFDTLSVQLPPTESQIAIIKDPVTSELRFDINTASATPGGLPSGMNPASVDGGMADRIQGVSTGDVRVKVLDDLSVLDKMQYSVDFVSAGSGVAYNVRPETYFVEKFVSRDTVYVPLAKKNLIADSVTVRDSTGAVVPPSSYIVDSDEGRIRGSVVGSLPQGSTFEIAYIYYAVYQSTNIAGEDSNPAFDGVRIYVTADPLGIDSLNSGWVVVNNTNLTSRIFRPTALPGSPWKIAPVDVQIVWNKTDRDARGKWLYPGDTLLNNFGRKVVVCPFKIVPITPVSQLRVLINNALADSVWKPGREIVFITPPEYSPQSPIPVMYSVMFSAPTDTTVTVVYPTEGNIYEALTTKPFSAGDQYIFTTTAAAFSAENAKSALDNIYVVPNPYVAYSELEQPGPLPTQRGEKRLQFRNLPPQCTVRIYTLVGELVQTIPKDDTRNFAEWDLLSYEGQRVAYGVYIYHIDVPGVGEKIGRFAVIK
jgi:hypothetical protein